MDKEIKLPRMRLHRTFEGKTFEMMFCAGLGCAAYVAIQLHRKSIMNYVNDAIQEDIPNMVREQLA